MFAASSVAAVFSTRCRINTCSADGDSGDAICARVGVSRPTVILWLNRYDAEGAGRLAADRPRSGRPKAITPAREAEIVDATLHQAPPDHGTHWSTRLMAEHVGVHQTTISRIWRAHGLKPHRVETFKVSTDPEFVTQLRDVVGLYLDPLKRAVVFSVDEQSQIEAFNRTQPGLPLKKRRAGTMTHDYERHGTTTLFAALNVASGEIQHECLPRHRRVEFLQFMTSVEATVPTGPRIHVILDNYGTHKTPEVDRWLKRHPRVQFHFTQPPPRG
ncbi:MAG TPA: IS630 family transposase [Gemmatimonadaceae bacterium]|nr:IS630 family transposase [Gemmatimonadaceae bacterium]